MLESSSDRLTTPMEQANGNLPWPIAGNTETGGQTEQDHVLYGRLRGTGTRGDSYLYDARRVYVLCSIVHVTGVPAGLQYSTAYNESEYCISTGARRPNRPSIRRQRPCVIVTTVNHHVRIFKDEKQTFFRKMYMYFYSGEAGFPDEVSRGRHCSTNTKNLPHLKI